MPRYKEHKEAVKQTSLDTAENNIARAADWILGETTLENRPPSESLVHGS